MLSENLACGYKLPGFEFGRYSCVQYNDLVKVTDMSQLIATPCAYATYSYVGMWGHGNVYSSGISRYSNYWNAAQNNFGVSDINVVKTVYDPCPVGFVVPPASAFSGMSLIKWISDAKARYTRYPGDTEGIVLYGRLTWTQSDDPCTDITLFTSSTLEWEGNKRLPVYFWASETETRYDDFPVSPILAQIRPIAEN